MGLLSSLFPPSTSAQEAHEAVQRREAVLLDVRERHEWKANSATPTTATSVTTAAFRRRRR